MIHRLRTSVRIPSNSTHHFGLSQHVEIIARTQPAPYRNSVQKNGDALVIGTHFLTCFDGMGGRGAPGTDSKIASLMADLTKKHGGNLDILAPLGSQRIKEEISGPGGCCALSVHVTDTPQGATVQIQLIGDCSFVALNPRGEILFYTPHVNEKTPKEALETAFETRSKVSQSIQDNKADRPYSLSLFLPHGSFFIAGTDSVLANVTAYEIATIIKQSGSLLPAKWETLLEVLASRIETAFILDCGSEGSHLALQEEASLAKKSGLSSFFTKPVADDLTLVCGQVYRPL